MSTIRIALANIRYAATPDESVALAGQAIEEAGALGAQVVFHPHFHPPEPGSYRPTTFGDPANTFHEKVPRGSVTVKIEWSKRRNAVSPYSVLEPDALKSVSFILKNSKRFRETSGWGYAQFLYDAASDTFKPYGDDSSFGKQVCYSCHTRVKAKDYIFTSYPKR